MEGASVFGLSYRLSRFLIRNWVLPSYIATDQKALTGGGSYWFLTKAKFDPDQTAV
jgi:hypothetical protein